MSTAAAAVAAAPTAGNVPLAQPPPPPPSSLRIIPGLGSLPFASVQPLPPPTQQQQLPNPYSSYNNNATPLSNNTTRNTINGSSAGLHNMTSQVRRVWVQRAGHVATSVFVSENDLVDDLKTLVYQRFPYSIGRALDPVDIVVRVRSQPVSTTPTSAPASTRQQSISGIPQARANRQPRAPPGHSKSLSQPNIGLTSRPGSPASFSLPTGPTHSPQQQQTQDDVWVALAPDTRVFDVLEQYFAGSQMPASAAFLIDVPAPPPLLLTHQPVPQPVQSFGPAVTSTAAASQQGGAVAGFQSPVIQVATTSAMGLATPTYGFPPLTPVVSAGPGTLSVTPGTPTIMAAVATTPVLGTSGGVAIPGQQQPSQMHMQLESNGEASEESEAKETTNEHGSYHTFLHNGLGDEVEATLGSGPDSPDFGSSIHSGTESITNAAAASAPSAAISNPSNGNTTSLSHAKTDSVGSSTSTASGMSFMGGAFGDTDDSSTLTPVASLANKTGGKHGSISGGGTGSVGGTGSGNGSSGSGNATAGTKKSGVILIPNKFKAQMGGSTGAGTAQSSGGAGPGKRGSAVGGGDHGGSKSLAQTTAAQRMASVSSGNSGPSSPVGARRDHGKRGGAVGNSIGVATAQAQGPAGSNGPSRSFSPSGGRPGGLSRTPSSASLTKARGKWHSGSGGPLPKTRSSMNLYLQQKGQQQQQQNLPPLTTKLLSTYTTVVPQVNVLIVEDNLINMRILERFLRQRRIRSDWAKNGREAIDKWRQGGFHLVLMDIQMPELSGLEATKEIRRLEQANRIGVFTTNESSSSSGGHSAATAAAETTSTSVIAPEDILDTKIFKFPVIIVALTASSALSDKTDALAAGCNDYLVKPVNLKWLWQKTIEWGCMQALIDFEGWKHWVSKAPPSISNGESGSATAASTTSAAAASATAAKPTASAGLAQGSSSNTRRPATTTAAGSLGTNTGSNLGGGSAPGSSNSSSSLGRKKTLDRKRSTSRARENRVVSSGANRVSSVAAVTSPRSPGLSPKLSSVENPGSARNLNSTSSSTNHAVSAPIAIPGRSRSSSSAGSGNSVGAFPRSSSLLSANGGILYGAVTPAAVSAAATTTATTTGTITAVATTSSSLNSQSSFSPSKLSLSASKSSATRAEATSAERPAASPLSSSSSAPSSVASPLRSPTATVLARACRGAATTTGDGHT